jgi:fatty-acyl-CoA synthase
VSLAPLTLSHVRGAETPPLLNHTIGAALARAAERWPHSEALVSVAQGIRWTFAELLERADAFAAGLLALGMEPGDRIGIWAPNCAEWALTQFAAARAGLILVTINPAYRLSEGVFTINKVGLRTLVVAERHKSSDYAAMVETLAPELAKAVPGALTSARLPALRAVIKIGGAARPGWIDFDDVAPQGGWRYRERLRTIVPSLDARQAINVQFTSGTTGSPKGAMLSHHNILNNGYFVGRAMALEPGDRICVPVPLYHCFGMVMGNLAGITHGAAVIYPGAAFEPDAVLRAVAAERCTALYGVPTMFIAELAHPALAECDLSSLRTGIMAGAPCPETVMHAVMERMNMREVTIAYGMTETSPVSFQTATDDSIERRVTSIGRVQPHLECKVIDEQGETVPAGVSGELCTRGYSVMLGYWGEPETTAAAIDNQGWMHTGDQVEIDAQGYGRVVGRLKDMVIRGGENIYPREVEEFLYRHPAIEDVAVVGVPDQRMGEELCAWIRLKPHADADEESVRAFCAGSIAHYKIPRYFRFVEAFPTTVTGKIQKYLIREAMVAELAGSETNDPSTQPRESRTS